MVGKYKNGSVVRRTVAPPPLPSVIGPGPANGPEHVPAQNPCSDIGKPSCREAVVDAGCAALASEHPFECLGRKSPFVQRNAAGSERIGEILAGTCAIAIDGNRETVHAQLGHEGPLFSVCPCVCSCTLSRRSDPRVRHPESPPRRIHASICAARSAHGPDPE